MNMSKFQSIDEAFVGPTPSPEPARPEPKCDSCKNKLFTSAREFFGKDLIIKRICYRAECQKWYQDNVFTGNPFKRT
jgi:hypothetical protein